MIHFMLGNTSQTVTCVAIFLTLSVKNIDFRKDKSMKRLIKERDILGKIAKRDNTSRKEVENEMMEVWQSMTQSTDPAVRKLAFAMQDHNKPPRPERLVKYFAVMAYLESVIPFIKAGYTERDYERLYNTELAAVLASKYDKTDLFRLSVEEFAKMRKAGII